MSLKRFFTGKPGNIGEFADALPNNTCTVDVLLTSCIVQNPVGDKVLEGRIRYSFGMQHDVDVGRNIVYEPNTNVYSTGVLNLNVHEEFEKRLEVEVRKNLEYLAGRGYLYVIKHEIVNK